MTATRAKALNSGHYLLTCLLLLLFIVFLFVLSLSIGSVSLSIEQVFNGLFVQTSQSIETEVIWNLRLPRTVLALVVGAHFALAGLILQAVIQNPLADPSVIGVNGGASLAIVVFLVMGDIITGSLYSGEQVLSLSWLPVSAFLGGIFAALLVLGLSWSSFVSPAKLALNGVAVGAILNAMVIWVVLTWGGSRTETSLLWLAGSLYGRDFSHLSTILPWTAVAILGLLAIQRPLSLMRFNNDLSQSLGLNLRLWRLIAISIAVALAASATSVAGPIGFVGLIVPHLSRLLVGSQIQRLTLVTILSGCCLTLAADILSRTLVSPLEFPTGALTTLMGIPVLLFLLQRKRGNIEC